MRRKKNEKLSKVREGRGEGGGKDEVARRKRRKVLRIKGTEGKARW